MSARRNLTVLSVLLLGAGPARPSDWTTLRAGATGAGQGVVVLSHTSQDIRGFTLHGVGSGVIGAPGVGTFGLRLGYHGGYGGLELGAGMWLGAQGMDSRACVKGWGGHPLGHAWVSTWPVESSGAVTTALSGVGLGHLSAHLSAEVGVWITEQAEAPLSAEVAYQRNEWLVVGLAGWIGPDDVRGMVTLSVSRAGLAAFYARGTAHPM